MPDTPETQAHIATRIGELEGMIARQLAGIREWERTANNLGKKQWVQRQADINIAYTVLRRQMEEANILRARIGLPLIIAPPQPVASAPAPVRASQLGCLSLIVGCMIVVGLLAWRTNTGVPTGGAPSSSDATMAQVLCQKAVRGRLKAPATATFGDTQRVMLAGDQFRVTGPVDAENSFGALLRMDYTCTIRFTGGDNYRIEEVSIHEP